jgi:two-component system, NarL family, nitrate/nitrite response regulator NarL
VKEAGQPSGERRIEVYRVVAYTKEPVLAAGLRQVLGGVPDLDFRGLVSKIEDILPLIRRESPDVFLLDAASDSHLGILQSLRSSARSIPIVLWVREIAAEAAYQAMEAGAKGLLRRDEGTDVLVRCLHKVAEGEVWFGQRLTAEFMSGCMIRLTPRESQLLSLLSRGMKNKEMATAMKISEGSVKVYLSRLFTKVGAKDRFELGLLGLKSIGAPSVGESGDFALLPKKLVVRRLDARAANF